MKLMQSQWLKALLLVCMSLPAQAIDTERWIIVFIPEAVKSCQPTALFNVLRLTINNRALQLIRPYSSCGLIISAHPGIDAHQLNATDGIKYIHRDEIKTIQQNNLFQ